MTNTRDRTMFSERSTQTGGGFTQPCIRAPTNAAPESGWLAAAPLGASLRNQGVRPRHTRWRPDYVTTTTLRSFDLDRVRHHSCARVKFISSAHGDLVAGMEIAKYFDQLP